MEARVNRVISDRTGPRPSIGILNSERESIMITFEVLVNGTPLYTMDAGEFGSLHSSIDWVRGKNPLGTVTDHFALICFAMNRSRQAHHYPERALKVGDEITVRIVETDVRDAHVTHPTWWK